MPRDIPEGVNRTWKAAEQEFGPAQNALGLCCSKGNGVPKDYVEPYKWFDLAAAKGGQLTDDARVSIAMAEQYLTPEQVAQAQRLAREFKPRKTSAAEAALRSAINQTNQPGTASITASPAAASKTGLVNVIAEESSGEIFVDGAFVGNTPARVKLTEGAHIVEVKKSGFQDYRKQIAITEGSELTLRVALEQR